jgi:paraquat-inducible protein B
MSRSTPTLIGAFVIGSLVLVVASVLFFGSGAFRENRLSVVSFFNGSVAGLRVGASVTFRGVPVGEVKALGVRVMPNTGDLLVQVDMELVPGTLAVYGAEPVRKQDSIPDLVQHGLTAQLVKESFVTGLLNVELAFRPGVQTSRVGDTRVPEVPTVPGDLEALTKQLQTVDVVATLEAFHRTLDSLNAILVSREVRQAVKDLPEITGGLKHALATVDREVTTISRTGRNVLGRTDASLQKTLGSIDKLAIDLDSETASTLSMLRGTLANANATLDETRTILDPQGQTVLQVQRTIDDLATTAARLRNFAERVDRNPSVLLRGR